MRSLQRAFHIEPSNNANFGNEISQAVTKNIGGDSGWSPKMANEFLARLSFKR